MRFDFGVSNPVAGHYPATPTAHGNPNLIRIEVAPFAGVVNGCEVGVVKKGVRLQLSRTFQIRRDISRLDQSAYASVLVDDAQRIAPTL